MGGAVAVRVVRAYRTEKVRIEWDLGNGRIYTQDVVVPPIATIEARGTEPKRVSYHDEERQSDR